MTSRANYTIRGDLVRRSSTMKAIPQSPEAWLDEITLAYLDARETIAFGVFVDVSITEKDLFHLAPVVCLKFRGIRRTRRKMRRATDAALSSYVASAEVQDEALSKPHLAFSFCYLASHYGLDLVDEETVDSVMAFLEKNEKQLRSKIASSNKIHSQGER